MGLKRVAIIFPISLIFIFSACSTGGSSNGNISITKNQTVYNESTTAILAHRSEINKQNVPHSCQCGDEWCVGAKVWRCMADIGDSCKWFKTDEVWGDEDGPRPSH